MTLLPEVVRKRPPARAETFGEHESGQGTQLRSMHLGVMLRFAVAFACNLSAFSFPSVGCK